MNSFKFAKKNRLAKKKEINKVFKSKEVLKNKHFVIYFLKNNFSFNRICIITSKKVGKAFRRNRLKRLVKEYFRLNQKKYNDYYDFIFILRKYNKIQKYIDVETSLNKLFSDKKIFFNEI